MQTESDRIGELASVLPPYVAVALQNSLRAWGIRGKLQRLVQPIGKDGHHTSLPVHLERQVYRRLESQAKVWRAIILGERLPTAYLTPRDRAWIAGLHLVLSLVLTLTVLALVLTFAAAVSGLALLLFPASWNVVKQLQPAGQAPTLEITDIISSLITAAPAVSLLWLAGRWLFQRLVEWDDQICRTLTTLWVQQRTLKPWS